MSECKHRWEQAWPGTYKCNKCESYTSTQTMNEYLFESKPQLSIASVKPSYLLSFHNADQKRVGAFDFNEGKMHFEGDVTESGKIFVDWVVSAFKQRITDAVKAEREACEAIEYDLAKSPAMFATMAEYNAYKDGVKGYRAKIAARGEA